MAIRRQAPKCNEREGELVEPGVMGNPVGQGNPEVIKANLRPLGNE